METISKLFTHGDTTTTPLNTNISVHAVLLDLLWELTMDPL
jgi:hypothetical protein